MPIKLISKQNKKDLPGGGPSGKGIVVNSNNIKKIYDAAKGVNDKDKKKIIMTSRRRKLVLILKKNSENIGKDGGVPKTLTSMIKEAGFKDSVADQQSEVLKPLREAGILDGFIDELDEKIKMCSEAMDKKGIKKQSPYTNALTIDILVKNRQLLSGKSTGIVGVDLTEDQMKKINDRLSKRLGK